MEAEAVHQLRQFAKFSAKRGNQKFNSKTLIMRYQNFDGVYTLRKRDFLLQNIIF